MGGVPEQTPDKFHSSNFQPMKNIIHRYKQFFTRQRNNNNIFANSFLRFFPSLSSFWYITISILSVFLKTHILCKKAKSKKAKVELFFLPFVDFTSEYSPQRKNQLYSYYCDVRSSTNPFHEQTTKYLTDNNILYLQDMFNNTSRSCLTDKTLTGFDSGLLTGMICIDLQKSLDTINHVILLKKMASRGFSNHSIIWFQLYLSDRGFRVNIKNKYSSTTKIECGVPQGSELDLPYSFILK